MNVLCSAARVAIVCLCLCVSACNSPISTALDPEVTLSYDVTKDRINVKATVRPADGRTLTLVDHPDFVRLDVEPPSTEKSQYVPGGVISWMAPTSKDLVKATAFQPAIFERSIPYSQKPEGRLLLGTDNTPYHPPAYLTQGRKLKVKFSYGIDNSQMPFRWKLGFLALYRKPLRAELPFVLR